MNVRIFSCLIVCSFFVALPVSAKTILDPFKAYRDSLETIVRTQNVSAAFFQLKNLYAQNDSVKPLCHELTHMIGRAALNKFHTLAEAYTQGDNFCADGYYHGVMEELSIHLGRAVVLEQINQLCTGFKNHEADRTKYFYCLHGLGHGLMAINDEALPSALDGCDLLRGSWEQQVCAGGVFMENTLANGENHVTNFLKPDDPLYPCDAVNEAYKTACYLNQGSYILRLHQQNFSAAFQTCAQADANYVGVCNQGLGLVALGLSLNDVDQASVLCHQTSRAQQTYDCLLGAAEYHLSYASSSHDSIPFQLCDKTLIEQRSSCRATIQTYTNILFPNRIQKFFEDHISSPLIQFLLFLFRVALAN